MSDGLNLNQHRIKGLRRQWAFQLLCWAAVLAWSLIEWIRGRPESHAGQHAGQVLVPLAFLGIAGAALLNQGSAARQLLRAVTWGSLLALVLLELIGR
jgi:hypothetical protein